MKVLRVAEDIPGYAFGDPGVSSSPVTLAEFEQLKTTVGWTPDDVANLHLAGSILADQTEHIVTLWRRKIIAGIPHLARHSQSLDGARLDDYLARSNLRFRQWILDTCLRPYDQDWLNYQHEIGLRHTSQKKNRVDGVQSTSHVPYRDVAAFVAVMNDTVKPFLAAKGHEQAIVNAMHRAWSKSLQLQLALWLRAYDREPADLWD
jgi:hypothetical protein